MFCIFFHYFYNSSPPGRPLRPAGIPLPVPALQDSYRPLLPAQRYIPSTSRHAAVIRLYGKTETSPADSSRLQI